MQPNQNPMGAPAVGGMPGAAAPNASANSAEPAMPKLTAREEIPEVPLAPVVAKKKSSGMVIGMVLLALVAVGGVGFGAYMFMEKGNVESKLEAAEKKAESLQKQYSELLEKVAKDTEEPTDESSDLLLTFEDYGIRVAFPTDFASVVSSQNTIGAYCVNGYTNKDGGGKPSFATNENATVCLYRTEAGKTDEVTSASVPSFSLGGFDYYVFAPQTISTTVPEEAAWEEESVKLLTETLKNIENYVEL